MSTLPEPLLGKPKLPISEFSAILRLRNSEGLPYLIIGGQSVNAWAHFFKPCYPALCSYEPFTSKDIDLLGAASDIRAIQKATGWEWLPGKADPKEFIAGALRFQSSGSSSVLLVEIIKRAQGATLEELIDQSSTIEITDQKYLIRVPSPLLLLRMKLENGAFFSQDVSNAPRQDVKHVRMLSIIASAFMEKLLTSPEISGEHRISIACDFASELFRIATSNATRIFSDKFGFKLLDCVPQMLFELAETEIPQTLELARRLTRAGLSDVFERRTQKRSKHTDSASPDLG